MLIVKTQLKESPIHGCGLFADQDIKQGEYIWKFNSNVDRIFLAADVEKMDEGVREFLNHYASKNMHQYFLSVDNARFINHSEEQNLRGDVIHGMYAMRDIKAGEELLVNYGLNPDFKGFKEKKAEEPAAEPAAEARDGEQK